MQKSHVKPMSKNNSLSLDAFEKIDDDMSPPFTRKGDTEHSSKIDEFNKVSRVCYIFALAKDADFLDLTGLTIQKASQVDPAGRIWIEFFNDYCSDPVNIEHVRRHYIWFHTAYRRLYGYRADNEMLCKYFTASRFNT